MAAWTLTEATIEDVPDLIRVHTAAYRSDLFSNLMLLNRSDEMHQALMQNSIEHWLAEPQAHIIKAAGADGQIVGWACWVLKERPIAAGKADKPTEETGAVPPDAPDQASVLGGLMSKEKARREDEHMAGTRYLALQGLATDPRFQGRGVGTRLIRWGTARASAEGHLPCWTHASPAACGLYAKNGFEEVGKSDYNLSEWAPGGKDGGRGWGVYSFRHMMRPPSTVDCDGPPLVTTPPP